MFKLFWQHLQTILSMLNLRSRPQPVPVRIRSNSQRREDLQRRRDRW